MDEEWVIGEVDEVLDEGDVYEQRRYQDEKGVVASKPDGERHDEGEEGILTAESEDKTTIHWHQT